MTKRNENKCPTWAWIVIIILAILVVLLFNYYRNSFSYEEYTNLTLEYAESVVDYGELGQDYLYLLDCYRKGLPTCEILNSKYGLSTFKQYSHGNCENNWYLVEGQNSCCPEPGMKIVDGYCS